MAWMACLDRDPTLLLPTRFVEFSGACVGKCRLRMKCECIFGPDGFDGCGFGMLWSGKNVGSNDLFDGGLWS